MLTIFAYFLILILCTSPRKSILAVFGSELTSPPMLRDREFNLQTINLAYAVKVHRYNLTRALGGGSREPPPKVFPGLLARDVFELNHFWHTLRQNISASNKKIIFEIGQNLGELQRLKLKLRISKS